MSVRMKGFMAASLAEVCKNRVFPIVAFLCLARRVVAMADILCTVFMPNIMRGKSTHPGQDKRRHIKAVTRCFTLGRNEDEKCGEMQGTADSNRAERQARLAYKIQP